MDSYILYILIVGTIVPITNIWSTINLKQIIYDFINKYSSQHITYVLYWWNGDHIGIELVVQCEKLRFITWGNRIFITFTF